MIFNIQEYREILEFISKRAKKTVKIVAVSKNHPISSVGLAIKAGIKVFGENRVQEAIEKFTTIKESNSNIELHLTGSLQTNKIKQALKIFDVFQTLDREKLAKEFIKHKEIVKEKKFFIQINTGKENRKAGIFPEDADSFINFCKLDLGLPIIGLMCIPPLNENASEHFRLLKNISLKNDLDCLSMGMSSDFKDGILKGATHIRVGTKLFGKRNEV